MSAVIARLGHTDQLTLCDAGLPIPAETQRIDLALTQGVPTFLQVFAAVTQEMQVESAILAEEIVKQNPPLHEALLAELTALGQRRVIPSACAISAIRRLKHKPGTAGR